MAANRLKDTIELISNTTEAFTAALFLFSEDRSELHLAAHHTLSKKIDETTTIRTGDGLIGWVAKSGQAVNIPNFNRDINSLGLYTGDEEIKSFLAVPVGREGVLCVDSKQTYLFTDKDQKILEGFVRIVEHNLAAGRSKEREKNYAKMLRILHEVDQALESGRDLLDFATRALITMKDFIGADVAFLVTPDGNGKRYRVEIADGLMEPNFAGTSYPIDSGLIGWVFRKGQPLPLKRIRPSDHKSYVFSPEDPIKKLNSFIGLPMTIRGHSVGAIGLIGYEPLDPTADQIAALTMAGRMIGTALKGWSRESE